MPYRARKETVDIEPAREGLVADMVRQFADRYAFARELVQNGIDAGASGLEARALYTRAGHGVFSLRDDGAGMTRAIIEGPLLTLFSSSKDDDHTKIGKYGVGFVSVFAIEPEQVVVETWRADGESWLLRLYPDHSYDLEQAPAPKRPSPSGTIVSLHKRMESDVFEEHMRGMGVSLRRWCRHARVPLHYVVEREGAAQNDDSARTRQRIDVPFDLVAPVKVTAELDGASYVVGPGAGSRLLEPESGDATFAGYYKRGLTLYETSSPPRPRLEGIRFKVDDASLQHTLSRDNVRHDKAYDRVLRHVQDLASGPLRDKLVAELQTQADAVARDEGDGLYYAALLEAACSWSEIHDHEIYVPLTNRLALSWTSGLDDIGREQRICYSAVPSLLTATVTERGRPVVRIVHGDMTSILATRVASPVAQIEGVYLLLEQRKAKKAERKLLQHFQRALESAGEEVTSIAMASTTGSAPLRAVVGVDDDGEHQLVHAEQHPRWRRRIGSLPRLLLLDGHRAVAAAVKLARRDAATAGELLARYALVEDRGELSKGQSDALLAAGAERMEDA